MNKFRTAKKSLCSFSECAPLIGTRLSLEDFPYRGDLNIIIYKDGNGKWTWDGFSGGGNWDGVEYYVAVWTTRGYKIKYSNLI